MPGRPPGPIAALKKRPDTIKLMRQVFAARLGSRPPGTLDLIHIDRVFAELLGEPLPRRTKARMRQVRRRRNGHSNHHHPNGQARDLAPLWAQLEQLDGAPLEAAALEIVAARFER